MDDTLPAWIEAIGTLLAFGLATLVYWSNSRRDSKSQARLVFPVEGDGVSFHPPGSVLDMWPKQGAENRRPGPDVARLCERVEHEHRIEYATTGAVLGWTGRIQNNSDQPVVGVVIGLAVGSKDWETAEQVGYIPPGGEVTSSRYFTHPPTADYFEGRLFTVVWFTDSNNVRWMQSLDQPLKRVTKRARAIARLRARWAERKELRARPQEPGKIEG